MIKFKEPNRKAGNTTRKLEIHFSKMPKKSAHAPAKFARFKDYCDHSLKLSGYLKTF